MRKTIVVKEEKEIIICDLCKKEVARGNYNVCSICDRHICDKCWKEKTEIKDIFCIPCPVCFKFANLFTNKIKTLHDEADKKHNEAFSYYTKWKRKSLREHPCEEVKEERGE